MTTTVPVDEEPRGGLLRRVRDKLAKPNAEARTLLSGRKVRLRFVQSTAWSIVAGLLGASFVAGLYYLGFEQHWYIHIGTFNHGSSAKVWWDNGMGWVHSRKWPDYRHGIRDLDEPAVAIMAVKTLLASPKYWDVRVGTARLMTAPVVLLAVAVGMAVGGVWLLDFGAPDAWAHVAAATGHRGYNLDGDFAWAGSISLGKLALGAAIGQVLHRWWAPVGATLQGFALDRAVDRAQGGGLLGNTPRVPLWERLPLGPPVVRERFAKMWRANTAVEEHGAHRKTLTLALTLMTLVTIVGILAKFVIAHGHSVPYLAP